MGGAERRTIYGAGRRAPKTVMAFVSFLGMMLLWSLGWCNNGELVCTAATRTCVVGHKYLPGSFDVSFDRASTVEVRSRKGSRIVTLHGPDGERERLLGTTSEHAEEVAAALRKVIAGERKRLRAEGRNHWAFEVYLALLMFLGLATILWNHWSHEAGEEPRRG